MSEPLEVDDRVVSKRGVEGIVIAFDHDKTMVQVQWNAVSGNGRAGWLSYPNHGLVRLAPKPEPAQMINLLDIDRINEVQSYADELGISLHAAIDRLISVGLGQPGCGAKSSSGYHCTLPVKHSGDHEAYGENEPVETWSAGDLKAWSQRVKRIAPGAFMPPDDTGPQHNPACLLVDGHDGDCIGDEQ